MTWPQPVVLGTHAVEHQDVFFNLWRLGWVSHALSTSPTDLFNGNQFHPERRVLAYSDAMLVEGVAAMPLLVAGMPPLFVHNLLLLGAIAASGSGAFTLARHLSGSTAGGIAAGIVFAFAPYRFEHYMHMELQWAMWIPWAFWALQRTLETRALRFGVITGAFTALQMLSSIYYGIFLAMLLALVGSVQLVLLRRQQIAATLAPLAAGALVAASVSWVYSVPYSTASSRVGPRRAEEVRTYSAKPRSYLSATENNLLYGATHRGLPERRLFPGIVITILAVAGVLLVAPPAWLLASLIGLAAAFELSLGLNGHIYPFLYNHVSLFQGLRAPARASIFCLMFLGVLGAQGCAAITALLPARAHRVLAASVAGLLLLEYFVAPLRLVRYENHPPQLYAWLARQPRGLVAEFPMPPADALPGEEARYAYMSTFHWFPLVNGYSGYYPPSYLARLERVEAFPDRSALVQLHADRVTYLIVHAGGYAPGDGERIVEALTASGLAVQGRFADGWGSATVFRLR